jgi:hypothetical protein
MVRDTENAAARPAGMIEPLESRLLLSSPHHHHRASAKAISTAASHTAVLNVKHHKSPSKPSGSAAALTAAGTASSLTNASIAKANPVNSSVGYAFGGDPPSNDAGDPVGHRQTPASAVLTGDTSTDGRVDFFDITQILGYKYNTDQPASYTDGDLDYSGHVDFFDIVLLLSANYNSGQTFGAPTGTPPTTCAASTAAS